MFPRSTFHYPIAVALMLLPRVASASDPAAAQALFDEGKQLVAQGLAAQACPKFEESERLDPGMGTEFHLADCWQRIGRSASAWAMFRQVESQAHASGQTAREQVAHDRANALEPFVPKLVILPQAVGGEPGLVVDRDGVAVDEPLWGTPMPVDPGEHVVHARAPGKVAWETTIQVPSNGNVVSVDVPPLVDQSPPPAAAAPSPPPASRPPTGVTSKMPPSTAETPFVENRGGFQRGLGWFFVGAGVVGVAVGGYFGVQWMSDRNAADPHCPNGLCDSYGASKRADARTEAEDAAIAAGAGAAAFVIGAALVATAPSPRIVMTPVAGVEITPIAAPGQAGLRVHGTW